MIRDFENWSNALVETSSLEDLRGCPVAIEAAEYINSRILNHPRAKEPLVPALGGIPLSFNVNVEDDLDKFAQYQIKPYFIFGGLDLAKQEDPFCQRQEGAAINAEAWGLYDQHHAEQSVVKFGESTYVTPEDLFAALQSILTQRNVSFLVAPYSAWAQMAYLEKRDHVVAVSGSSESLLFNCNTVITSWDFEAGLVKSVKKSKCVESLSTYANNAQISDDMFVDACVLAGTHFLPTLPSLDLPPRSKLAKPIGAIDAMMSNGRSGISVCMNFRDDPTIVRINYLDRYRRARLAIKHHPILTVDGKIEPSLEKQLPNDAHEVIGQRLPDEMYYYLSRGLINSRIIGWRATGEIIEGPPMDGGDSPQYHELVSTKLTPLRTTAINLLSSSLHNWYQHKDLTLKCWFPDSTGKPTTSTITMRGLPESRRLVEKWNVKEATFRDVVAKNKGGLLRTAVLALNDSDFVSKSSSSKDVNNQLSTEQEILYNATWRFLALRDYVDMNHNLTSWGKVLATVLESLKGHNELEEAALTVVELLRLGILNSDAKMFPYNGAPMRGELKDRNFNLLISRVAGVGSLRHNPIGFTGPLSQHLLGYNSMINAVRSTLRDLVEVGATHMFMGGFAKRDIDNISSLAMRLPFLLPNNCALSIAVKSYLDELYTKEDPTSSEAREYAMSTASTRYFPQSVDLVDDLNTAFQLWDAVFAGVKSSGNLVREADKKHWTEANEWLSQRR